MIIAKQGKIKGKRKDIRIFATKFPPWLSVFTAVNQTIKIKIQI